MSPRAPRHGVTVEWLIWREGSIIHARAYRGEFDRRVRARFMRTEKPPGILPPLPAKLRYANFFPLALIFFFTSD